MLVCPAVGLQASIDGPPERGAFAGTGAVATMPPFHQHSPYPPTKVLPNF